MPSNHFILCHPPLLLPSIFSSIRVFSTESALHMRRPKYWSLSSSKEYPGLISFRMDWFDLLAVQETLKSLLQVWHAAVHGVAKSWTRLSDWTELNWEWQWTSTCQCRRNKRCQFDPWVRKIPWRRAWQPTPVFLPGEFHGQRSMAGYSPWGHKEWTWMSDWAQE